MIYIEISDNFDEKKCKELDNFYKRKNIDLLHRNVCKINSKTDAYIRVYSTRFALSNFLGKIYFPFILPSFAMGICATLLSLTALS